MISLWWLLGILSFFIFCISVSFRYGVEIGIRSVEKKPREQVKPFNPIPVKSLVNGAKPEAWYPALDEDLTMGGEDGEEFPD